MSTHKDRLSAELDRQLVELRATCDGLATRAGVLMTAVGIGAAIVAARIGKSTNTPLLIFALTAFGLATFFGLTSLVPRLKVGPTPVTQAIWWEPQPRNGADLLFDSKLTILAANIERWQAMRILFAFQTGTTIAGLGLALAYA